MSGRSAPTSPSMNSHPPMPDSATAATVSSDFYFGGSSIVDMDQFTKALSNIKSKNVGPGFLASIVTHYASKWLPELSSDYTPVLTSSPIVSSTANWLKKRFLVENLVDILPSEKGSMPCEFLPMLLRLRAWLGPGQRTWPTWRPGWRTSWTRPASRW